MKKVTTSAADTRAFGRTLAQKARGGDIYGLIGDLGGGKTTLTKGFAEGMGVTGLVTSPTFILMNIFPVTTHATIKHLCHVDTYRMRSIEEALDLGLTEWLERPDTVTLIEWADALLPVLRPYRHTLIHFAYRDEHTRQLTVTTHAAR